MSTSAIRKLPVLETVSQSMLYSVRNIGFLIRIAWLWVLLIAGVGLVIWGLIHAMSDDFAEQIFDGSPPSVAKIMELGLWAMLCILIVAACSIAVRWHRHFLTGETPGWFGLKFTYRELSYVGYCIGIGVICSVAMGMVYVMIDVLTPAIGNREVAEQASIGVRAVVAILIFVRLHLVLPGTAVGDQRISLRHSFDLTRGNSWRIAGGFGLILLPHLMLGAILFFALPWSQFSTGAAATAFLVVLALILILGSMIFSYMSHCFGRLVPPPGEGDLAE